MAVLHHLHRELLKDCVNLIQSSPSTVTFYKVKSHSGIIGNECADHLAHKAAVNQISDVSLPPANDPFYDLFWLSVVLSFRTTHTPFTAMSLTDHHMPMKSTYSMSSAQRSQNRKKTLRSKLI
jgi:hypothetical protein